MGRFLLLILVAATIGTAIHRVASVDSRMRTAAVEQDGQAQSLAREVADAGHTAVLAGVIDPATGRLRTSAPMPEWFDVYGGRVRLTDYTVRGTEVTFTVAGYHGGSAHQVTSRYRYTPRDFPGPLLIAAPYATLDMDDQARVSGRGADGDRAAHFDAARFAQYGLGSVLSLQTLEREADRALGRAGTVDLQVHDTMQPVLAEYGTPSPYEIYARALTLFDPARDVRASGPTTIAGRQDLGGADDAIAHFDGDLTITETGLLRGQGLLLVEGHLNVAGRLEWDGLVLARTSSDQLRVDLGGTDGRVRIDGAVIVDQEAPPPGGHTDLTVYRDLTGVWDTPAGETGNPWTAYRPWTAHTHRFAQTVGEQTVRLAQRGSDPQEARTRFRATLDALGDEEVFVRFNNREAHGAAQFTLRAGALREQGFVLLGFDRDETGDSPSFPARSLDDLIVDVASLRMLTHLTDRVPSTSPEADCSWDTGPWIGGCRNVDRPWGTGFLRDRDGALTVQLRRAADGALLYEAAIYWHTKGEGHPQFLQEQAADAAWRAAVEASGDYGTRIAVGRQSRLTFDLAPILPVLERLGITGQQLEHLGSVARFQELGEHDRATGGLTDRRSGTVPMCVNGATRNVALERAGAVEARGGRMGACGSQGAGVGAADVVLVCHQPGRAHQTQPVTQADLAEHLGHGDYEGACRSR